MSKRTLVKYASERDVTAVPKRIHTYAMQPQLEHWGTAIRPAKAIRIDGMSRTQVENSALESGITKEGLVHLNQRCCDTCLNNKGEHIVFTKASHHLQGLTAQNATVSVFDPETGITTVYNKKNRLYQKIFDGFSYKVVISMTTENWVKRLK
jgi:hypothetical protein